jgi:hypothetical protein
VVRFDAIPSKPRVPLAGHTARAQENGSQRRLELVHERIALGLTGGAFEHGSAGCTPTGKSDSGRHRKRVA